jgi:hypothetical protein
MALRAKRGELKKPSAEVKKVAKSMNEKQLGDFARGGKDIKYHKRST